MDGATGRDNFRSGGLRVILALFLTATLLGPAWSAILSPPTPALAEGNAEAPTPAARYVGHLSLAPDHGPAGTEVTATGTSLPANSSLSVIWNTVKGSWVLSGTVNESFKGRKFDPAATEMATATTDDQGNFTAKFRVPEDFGFLHDVTVKQDGVIVNQAAFELEPQVSISPARGPAGTPITVTVNGIGYQYLYNVWQLAYDNKFTGWVSSVTTQGKAVVTIPATGAPGKHLVQVLAGIPDMPYLNTQQSPTPDRPSFAFTFEVTDGPAVLPPAASAQGLPALSGQAPDGSGPLTWVDPQRAAVGTSAVFHGRGLAPQNDAQIVWTRVVGNRMSGNGWSENSVVLGSTKIGPDGSFDYPFSVPDDLGGPHQIAVRLADDTLMPASLTVSASALPITPTSGPVGTDITLHLKGGGWTETANIYTFVYDNAYLGYACAFNSQGDVVVHLPAAGAPGWHFIDVYPAIYKGEDVKGVDNFRVPQLTYAQDHPGENLPAFHFAFQVTK
ncbi:MAG: hypothetical protein M1389_04110 [Chloroflexi bacterium]|nr:hypothetical protein [Chloroflexota bacterium]